MCCEILSVQKWTPAGSSRGRNLLLARSVSSALPLPPCWNTRHRCGFRDLSLTHAVFRVNCQRPQMLFGDSPQGGLGHCKQTSSSLCFLQPDLKLLEFAHPGHLGWTLQSVCLLQSHSKSSLVLLGIPSELLQCSTREQSRSVVVVAMKVA